MRRAPRYGRRDSPGRRVRGSSIPPREEGRISRAEPTGTATMKRARAERRGPRRPRGMETKRRTRQASPAEPRRADGARAEPRGPRRPRGIHRAFATTAHHRLRAPGRIPPACARRIAFIYRGRGGLVYIISRKTRAVSTDTATEQRRQSEDIGKEVQYGRVRHRTCYLRCNSPEQ